MQFIQIKQLKSISSFIHIIHIFPQCIKSLFGLGLGLDHWSFIWLEHSVKFMPFLNCKLGQITLMKPLEIKPLHKGMAETDVSYEFGREPGFSSSVFGPEHSHMLHMEVPLRYQLNAQS